MDGLSYVPYTSRRGSKRLSGGDLLHAESTEQSSSNESPQTQSLAVRPEFVTVASTSSSASASSLSNSSPVERPAVTASSSSTSTFRRLGPKPTPTSSPLRPKATGHASTPSRSSLLVLDPGAGTDSPKTTPLQRLFTEPPPPPAPAVAEPTSSDSPAPTPPSRNGNGNSAGASPRTSALPYILPELPKTSPIPQPIPLPSVEHKPLPAAPSPAPISFRSPTPRTPTPSASSSPLPNVPHRAPYRQGFQPKGAYAIRTDEFLLLRSQRTTPQRGEERRIERRLEKLINLHFPPPGETPSTTSDARPAPARRSSSFFDFSDLKVRNPGDLLRSVVEPKAGTPAAIRAAEQIITPWQDDSAASECPHCQTSFHPITNRKHHCRLCGRVVCALPPKKPNRLKPCSLLITADRQTGRIMPVPETIAYGVTKRPSMVGGSSSSSVQTQGQKDTAPKSFRICKECNAVTARKDLIHEAHMPTAFTRLHDLLVRIEGDIETELANLEAILPTAHLAPSTPEVLTLRKQLTGLFSDYDAVAKRIRALPVPASGSGDGGGSGQERVQQAVWGRAVNFMQMHIGLLQRLPKPPSHKPSKSTVSQLSTQEIEKMTAIANDTAAAHSLQPLLEQEALLESFIQEATAQRKFEDVKSLKSSLSEIRGEIERMVASSYTH